MESENYLTNVREQYENFPYPERNPEDEKERLYAASTECLDKVNYYCFEGKKDFSSKFRALIAGGGTGDATIFLAEQLREFDAEIVYLDMTLASMEVAKKRAEIRRLENITWLHASLLDLPDLNIGKFDYINCSGVLHHLQSPPQGLAALNSVLKDDGAMAIMVYAKYGRTAIYQMQDLMRRVNSNEESFNTQIENCRTILNGLPASNWYNHSRPIFTDQMCQKTIELFDLFLHTQDRAYSIPELYEYMECEGLNILHLLPVKSEFGNNLYKPSTYINDKGMLKKVKKLPEREQQAIAELMHGMMIMHTAYVAKDHKKPPSLDTLTNIPFLDMNSSNEIYKGIYSAVCESFETVTLENSLTGLSVNFPKSKYTESIFEHLDGERSLQEIYKRIMNSSKMKKLRPTIPALHAEFKVIFKALLQHHWIFLRDKSIKNFIKADEMQKRVNNYIQKN